MGNTPRSFSCRWDMPDVGKDCFTHFLPGCRESACWPPALWLGAPLKAAAGRATAAKLQTYWGCKVFECPFSSCMRPPFKDIGQSFIDCSPRTRGKGGRHGHKSGPVTLARNTRAGSGRSGSNNSCVWMGDMLMSFNFMYEPRP